MRKRTEEERKAEEERKRVLEERKAEEERRRTTATKRRALQPSCHFIWNHKR